MSPQLAAIRTRVLYLREAAWCPTNQSVEEQQQLKTKCGSGNQLATPAPRLAAGRSSWIPRHTLSDFQNKLLAQFWSRSFLLFSDTSATKHAFKTPGKPNDLLSLRHILYLGATYLGGESRGRVWGGVQCCGQIISEGHACWYVTGMRLH